MAASSTAVVVCVLFNVIVAFLCFILFSMMRVSKFGEKFYAARRFAKDIRLKPQILKPGLFSWIWPVWTYPEGDIIDELGLDAAMYLRICNFGYHFFFYVSLWCLCVVLPVNLTGNEVEHLETMHLPDALTNSTDALTNSSSGNTTASVYSFTTFDRCTMSNVAPGSMRLWVHAVSVYVITAIAVVLLSKYNRESIKLRVLYLACIRPGGASHTVLVTDIPGIEGRRFDGHAKLPRGASAGKLGLALVDDAAVAAAAAEEENGHGGDGAAEERTNGHRGGGIELEPAPGSGFEAHSRANGAEGAAVPRQSDASDASPADAYGLPSPGMADACLTNAPGEDVSISVPLADGRQRRLYNIYSGALDAHQVAAAKLAKGMTPKAMIESEFCSVYPKGAVVAVNTVNNQASLEPLVDEYDRVKRNLDDYLDECNFRMDKGIHVVRKKTVVRVRMSDWVRSRRAFTRPDAIEHWTARLRELSRQICEEQDKCGDLATTSAFVTFNTRMAQGMAAASLHHHDEMAWRLQAAPEARELLWKNLRMRVKEKAIRFVIFALVFAVFALFFMAPVFAIQGVIDLPRLTSSPIGKRVANLPVLSPLLQAIVPGLLLLVLLYYVPIIIGYMVRASGAMSESQVDFGVMNRFFIFQVIVIFLVNVVGGTFFSQLRKWFNDPASAITILGETIPLVSTFFITFILLNGVGYASISSLRLGPLTMTWLYTTMAGSPKAKYRVWSQQYISYGGPVVNHTLTLLLALVYSVINPIITPIAFLHYVINGLIERYQNLYIWRRRYESFGRLWKNVFNQVMFALHFFQFSMIGLLSIKQFKYTPLLAPLPVLTIIYHLTSLRLYSRPWSFVSQHDAAVLDVRERPLLSAVSSLRQRSGGGAGGSPAVSGGGAAGNGSGGGAGPSTSYGHQCGDSTVGITPPMRVFGARREGEEGREMKSPGFGRAPKAWHKPRGRGGRQALMPQDGGTNDSSAAAAPAGGTDGDQSDPGSEADEPVEVAYLSRLFKIRLPADMMPLLQEAEATARRIADQPPLPTMEEAAARRTAARAARQEGARAVKEERRVARLSNRRGGSGSNGAGQLRASGGGSASRHHAGQLQLHEAELTGLHTPAGHTPPISPLGEDAGGRQSSGGGDSPLGSGIGRAVRRVEEFRAARAAAGAASGPNGAAADEDAAPPIPVSTAPESMQRSAQGGTQARVPSHMFTISDEEASANPFNASTHSATAHSWR